MLEKEFDDRRLGLEGYAESRWILLDFGDVVVHLFDEETRDYYDLEQLWAGAKRVPFESSQPTIVPRQRRLGLARAGPCDSTDWRFGVACVSPLPNLAGRRSAGLAIGDHGDAAVGVCQAGVGLAIARVQLAAWQTRLA